MKIICLANSYKHQGRCIAGIDMASGQWVRPISNLDDGRIPIENQYIKAEHISILDIIDIPIDVNRKSGYEIENYCYTNRPWQTIGQAKVVDLLNHREQELIYSYYGRAIPYNYLNAQSPLRTLQLIEVKSLSCYKNSRDRWRARILDEKYDFADFDLSITDPIALDKLNRGGQLSSHNLICMSLGQPWQATSADELMCYRLIAGIIEVLPELELILQEMERVRWNTEQGRQYLRENFYKESRYQLNEAEAKQFLLYLQNLPTSD